MHKMIILIALTILFHTGGAQAADCGTCTQFVETSFADCPAGQQGQITNQRTVNVSGVCGVNGAIAEVSRTCAIPFANNPIEVKWERFASDDDNIIFSGPGGKAINNCGAGWTHTEVTDDSDSVHTLAEDAFGGRRTQLCIRTTRPTAELTSAWVNGSCPAGMQSTTLSDSEGGNSNPKSKRYTFKHELPEEEGINSHWNWCIGLTQASLDVGATLNIRQSGTSTCNPDEAFLVHWHGNEKNFNHEDGSNNRALCISVISPL